jgi:hypothetical protein
MSKMVLVVISMMLFGCSNFNNKNVALEPHKITDMSTPENIDFLKVDTSFCNAYFDNDSIEISVRNRHCESIKEYLIKMVEYREGYNDQEINEARTFKSNGDGICILSSDYVASFSRPQICYKDNESMGYYLPVEWVKVRDVLLIRSHSNKE